MQTTTFGGDPDHPSHYLPGSRPDVLPISAKVWDVAKDYGKQSEAVGVALYEAVKKLEAAQHRDTSPGQEFTIKDGALTFLDAPEGDLRSGVSYAHTVKGKSAAAFF